jgi:uncharacterized membrane protein
MAETTDNARLEAFSDGVFAIALTLLIIDVKLPGAEDIASTPEFWRALQHLLPSLFAFLLSFGIILITWVNHRSILRLVSKSCGSFIYANGLLLLTVVFVPFPTALLGAVLLSDHAAPAVVLYDAVLALQSIGWILLTRSALSNDLTSSDKARSTLRDGNRNGYFAFALYSLFSITALWFPLVMAIVTTVSWIFWLALGIRNRNA